MSLPTEIDWARIKMGDGAESEVLSERGLAWAVGIPFKQKVYPADVTMLFPIAGRGRPRKNAIPDVTSVSAQTSLTIR